MYTCIIQDPYHGTRDRRLGFTIYRFNMGLCGLIEPEQTNVGRLQAMYAIEPNSRPWCLPCCADAWQPFSQPWCPHRPNARASASPCIVYYYDAVAPVLGDQPVFLDQSE